MSIVSRLIAPRDYTRQQAEEDRARDMERLQGYHRAEWEYVLTPSMSTPQLRWRCLCNLNSWFNSGSLETHIKDSIRAERGPKKTK